MDLFSETEDTKPQVSEIESCEPEVSTVRTYSKRTVATHTVTQPSTTSESPVCEEKSDDFNDLKSVVKKLEAISEKLAATKYEDDYEQFGKYLGTLLRGVPIKKFLKLKTKLITDVMQARMASDGGFGDFTSTSGNSAKSSNVPKKSSNVRSAINICTATSGVPGSSATSDKDIHPPDRRVVLSNNPPVLLQNLSLSTSSSGSSVMMSADRKNPLMNICYPTSIPHTRAVFVPLKLAISPSIPKPTNHDGSQNTSSQDVPPVSTLPSKTITTPLIVSQPDNRLTKEDENKADVRDSDCGTPAQKLSKTMKKVYQKKAVIRNDNDSSPSQQQHGTVISTEGPQGDSTTTKDSKSKARNRDDDGDASSQDLVTSPDILLQTHSTHSKHPSNTDISGDDDGGESSGQDSVKQEISQWFVGGDDEDVDIEVGNELENFEEDIDPLSTDIQDQTTTEHEAVTLEPPDPGEIGKIGSTSSDPETFRFFCELCPSSFISTSFVSSSQLKKHFKSVHPGSSPRWKTTHPGGDEKSSKRKCPDSSTSKS